MIVVDTNTIAYYLIQGEHTAEAHEVRRKDPDWIVPHLWRHEFLNILALYLRQDGLSMEECREIWVRSQKILHDRERETDMLAALRTAADNAVSAYDAQFITLARQHDILCVTSDGILLKKFDQTAISMGDFCGSLSITEE